MNWPATPPLFEVQDLHVTVGGTEILKGVNLVIGQGEIHALMGPNGSGKSTLANSLLGNPDYVVTGGRILFKGEDITSWPTDVRGKAGIFLAFQYPEEIPGVPIIQFLRQALSARKGLDLSVLELRLSIMEWMKKLDMDPAFGDRYLNEGFSGGEKKRNEILQMAILEPELAILDETDSGLDIDALHAVARGVQQVRAGPAHPRGVGHHPLPAHPGRADARCGAPADRRTGRGQRRPGTGSPARRGGVRGMALDVELLKKDFPILDQLIHGHRLVYLDSASSSQKPAAVLDAMQRLYETTYANVHRGVYAIAEESTRLYEEARTKLVSFIGAGSGRELIFTKNVTEAINLVAYAWGRANLAPGDVVLLTEMEHHANLVPVAAAQGRAGYRAALPGGRRRRQAHLGRPGDAAPGREAGRV